MRRSLPSLVLLLVGPCATAIALASPAARAPATPATAREIAIRTVEEQAARAEPSLRAEVSAGELDPQLRFAPCEALQAQVRPGAPMRGRVIVTVRCERSASGGGWTASVPVTVRLYGPALVASRPIAALEAVPVAGLRTEDVEWTREPMGLATRPEELEDRISMANVAPGQPLPLRALRARPAVGQGDTVRLVGSGGGFQISTEAVALAAAAPGEQVRVRTEAGRTLSGIARRGRVVEVEF